MPLNINLQQILLHALNFVILFGALYFLLYKPASAQSDTASSKYLMAVSDSSFAE